MGFITAIYKLVSALAQNRALSKSTVADRFLEVFKEYQGSFPGVVHLSLDPTVTSEVSTTSRVPVSINPQLEQPLWELEKKQTTTKLDQPTPWFSQTVVTKKKSGKSNFASPKETLIQALRRERRPLAVLEHILPELSLEKVFSKLDLTKWMLGRELTPTETRYVQIKKEEEDFAL